MDRYAVLSERVTHQNIDGEVIAIHFDTGIYYSLPGSAAIIWDYLVEGATAEEITDSFTGQPSDAVDTIMTFLDQLVSEGLVEARREGSPRPEPSRRVPWAPPSLEKFTDMSDLIMADPIHDVDEMGWPNLAAPPGEPKT